jgi:hypothetical protein
MLFLKLLKTFFSKIVTFDHFWTETYGEILLNFDISAFYRTVVAYKSCSLEVLAYLNYCDGGHREMTKSKMADAEPLALSDWN